MQKAKQHCKAMQQEQVGVKAGQLHLLNTNFFPHRWEETFDKLGYTLVLENSVHRSGW